MRLSLLTTNLLVNQIICEGYGVTWSGPYDNWKIDPTPNVWKLGEWIHPTTGNRLVGGINLNYLSPQYVEELRYYAPEILRQRRLKERYWEGMRLVPDVFKRFYRTYDAKYINVVQTGTLPFLTPKQLEKQGDKDKAKELEKRRKRLTGLKKAKVAKRSQKEKETQTAVTAAKTGVPPIVPPVPAAPAPAVPPEVPPTPEKTSREKGQEQSRAQRADKLSRRIDDRVRGLITPPEQPVPQVPPTPPEAEAPEEPEEPEIPPEEVPPPEEAPPAPPALPAPPVPPRRPRRR